MQGNKLQILHCDCGLIYMSNSRRSGHAISCRACGRTPRIEHLNQSIPAHVPQRLSSVWRESVLPGALTMVGIIGLVVVLPRTLSQPVQSSTGLPTLKPASALSSSRSPISLPNGTNLTPPQGLQGYANLTVNNGTPHDAVVKLVDSASGQTIRFVYVQANHDVAIENIPSCTCIFKFSTGRDWDKQTRRFLQNPSFSQFTDPFTFEEVKAEDGVKWRGYQVTLHSVPAGNAQTTPISERNFENNK